MIPAPSMSNTKNPSEKQDIGNETSHLGKSRAEKNTGMLQGEGIWLFWDHLPSKAASNVLHSRASTSYRRTQEKKSSWEYKSALGAKDNILEDGCPQKESKVEDLDDLRVAECVFSDLFMNGASK